MWLSKNIEEEMSMPKYKKSEKVIIALVCISLIIVLAFLLYPFILQVVWQKTEAIITLQQNEVTYFNGKNGTVSRNNLYIEYSYTVGNINYAGTKTFIGISDIIKNSILNSKISVLYNPLKNSESMYLDFSNIGKIAILSFVLLVLLLVLIFGKYFIRK